MQPKHGPRHMLPDTPGTVPDRRSAAAKGLPALPLAAGAACEPRRNMLTWEGSVVHRSPDRDSANSYHPARASPSASCGQACIVCCAVCGTISPKGVNVSGTRADEKTQAPRFFIGIG